MSSGRAAWLTGGPANQLSGAQGGRGVYPTRAAGLNSPLAAGIAPESGQFPALEPRSARQACGQSENGGFQPRIAAQISPLSAFGRVSWPKDRIRKSGARTRLCRD